MIMEVETTIPSEHRVKVVVYNTEPFDDRVEQILTALIDWNAHEGVFKRHGERVVSFVAASPLQGMEVGTYLDTTLYFMEKQA
jgi:hypothetical protein